MLFGAILERFALRYPVGTMTRASLEFALAPADLDRLFHTTAETQYERQLLFSSMVDLMTVVVAKIQPSVRAAYLEVAEDLATALPAVYEKLAHTELSLLGALTRHTFTRLSAVLEAAKAARPQPLPGWSMRLLDGNHLAATERRLSVLWDVAEAPLPGQTLVIYDPSFDLIRDVVPCDDGHANERTMLEQILAKVQAGEVWVADRNFCTLSFLQGLARRQAAFVIRHHAALPLVSAGTLRRRGTTETGEVFEHDVTVGTADGGTLQVRRIVLRLKTPTRDGDREMALLTNLPAEHDAVRVAEVYRGRWTIETMFQKLVLWLASEINTLAYPRAALFGFTVACATFNVLQTVMGCLRSAHGSEKVDEEVSGYFIANEARRCHEGLDTMLDPEEWEPFRSITAEALAEDLLRWARGANLARYPKAKRGPKKPKEARVKSTNSPHVSTAVLLRARKGKITP